MNLSNKISGIDDVQVEGCILQKMMLVVVNGVQCRKPVDISYIPEVLLPLPIGDNWCLSGYWCMVSDNHYSQSFQTEPTMLDLIAFASKAYSDPVGLTWTKRPLYSRKDELLDWPEDDCGCGCGEDCQYR
jgi:hypothetical protein